ncbi:NADP-dependent oxidoreductase domain-containing protein [Cladochytrium replicatum]|nr:NADP-dependent oxidoreductase domain-containing protein [Cladochytrium replicatum]
MCGIRYVRLLHFQTQTLISNLYCKGDPNWGAGVLGREESLEIIKTAYDAGVNFFDTANVYSNGESERVVGEALRKFDIPRQTVVIATKVFAPVNGSSMPNQKGLSRKHIFEACEASLERFGLDSIDLYQIHRWDYDTPIDETMEALNDLVRSGKVRYLGACSMFAWQLEKANAVAEKNGWAKFVSMQNYYNLLYREEEREVIPYCIDAGLAVIPYSPLARGLLALREKGSTARSLHWDQMYDRLTAADLEIMKRVGEVSERLGIAPTQVAIAWLLAQPGLTAPILGFTQKFFIIESQIKYIDQAIAACGIQLSQEDIKYLNEPYQPKKIESR